MIETGSNKRRKTNKKTNRKTNVQVPPLIAHLLPNGAVIVCKPGAAVELEEELSAMTTIVNITKIMTILPI